MYAKVFSQIFDSSISEDYLVRYVFIDMLVLADCVGHVDMTIPAISRRTNVPQEIVSRSIERLSQPDPHSRSREEDGRRLTLLDSRRDWGWKIVNYEQYDNMRDENARRTYMRDYQRTRRSKLKQTKDCKQRVNSGKHGKRLLAPSSSPSSSPVPTPKDSTPLASSEDRSPQLGVFELPLVDGSEFAVPQNLFAEYVKAYPGVVVMAEFGEMRAWLISNPKNKKTRNGIMRFMANWLGKAQNQAPTAKGGKANGRASSIPFPDVV